MGKFAIGFLILIGLLFVHIFGDDFYVEDAPWFGTTGLPEEVEREVPRYLRRSLGEPFYLSKSLKARDLMYVGAFDEGVEHVHYWRIPWTGKDLYAYVVRGGERPSLGWSGRKPPEKK